MYATHQAPPTSGTLQATTIVPRGRERWVAFNHFYRRLTLTSLGDHLDVWDCADWVKRVRRALVLWWYRTRVSRDLYP